MQERKEYKLSLTQQQAEKLQQLMNMTSFTNGLELEEIKEEVNERWETIKSIECYMQNCDRESENCQSCEYNSSITRHRVNVIALKHIMGYLNIMRMFEHARDIDDYNDYFKGYKQAIMEFLDAMEQEFDISEV